MEGHMDWLPNDVCEDFANVGISCTSTEPVSGFKLGDGYQNFGCESENKPFPNMSYPALEHSRGVPSRLGSGVGLLQNSLVSQSQSEVFRQDGVDQSGCNTNAKISHKMDNFSVSNGNGNRGIDENVCFSDRNFRNDDFFDEWNIGSDGQKFCPDIKSTIDDGSDGSNLVDSSSMDDLSYQDMALKKRDQKRRPKPKDGTVLICQICGDRALGYNFDAITCESCKAFFRRNALKTKVFTCSFEGNCKLDPHTRKFCSGCRLKKCIDVGMKKQWILSDDQLAKRRKKSTRSSSGDEMKFHSPSSQLTLASPPLVSPSGVPGAYRPPHKLDMYSPTGSSSEGEVNSTNYMSDSTENSSINSPPASSYLNLSPPVVKTELNEDNYFRPIPPDVALEIQQLEKDYNGVFDSGYTDDQSRKFTEKPHNANDLFNMTDIFIRRLIKFAKHIPEFKALKQEDQIHLLKGGIMEIMVLRSAMGFDPEKFKWKVREQQSKDTEHTLDPSIIKDHLGSSMYTDHIQFVKGLHQLTRSDRTVMTLMFVIEIFSPDRANLKNAECVKQTQDKFTRWLQLYLESAMPVVEAERLYPELLKKMLEVRSIGDASAKLASNLDISKLEPLLIEVFNLQK